MCIFRTLVSVTAMLKKTYPFKTNTTRVGDSGFVCTFMSTPKLFRNQVMAAIEHFWVGNAFSIDAEICEIPFSAL